MATSRKRRTRRRRAHRRRGANSGQIGIVAVVIVIVLLGIVGYVVFDDRHWRAFDNAGDVAFERGNHDYAERMYEQALQVARELEDRKLIAASLQALSRTYAAQGRDTEALDAARQAQRLAQR